MRIVAFLPNWLGDVAMCTPALRALSRIEGAELTVAGRPGPLALVRSLPYLHGEIGLGQKGLGGFLRNLLPVRRAGRDIAVVMPHSQRAALQAWLAGCRRRTGIARENRAWLFTDPVAPHRDAAGRIAPTYMAAEYLELAAAMGAQDDCQGLELAADPGSVEAFRAALPAEHGPIVGFAPGAAFGPSKCWLPERYAAVADALRERAGATCILLTGPGEEDTRAAVQQAAKAPLVIPDGGKPTIASLKAAISQLDLLVGNDSGPRHVAVAFGVPIVCIMGPTAPVYSCGPYEKGEVLRVDVDCGPCQQPTCATDHRCMTRISAEAAAEAALRHLPGLS